jgi:hypothetical protein
MLGLSKTLARDLENTSFIQMKLNGGGHSVTSGDPLFVSRVFRPLRWSTKDAVLGTCDLLKKVDQNFSADNVQLGFM